MHDYLLYSSFWQDSYESLQPHVSALIRQIPQPSLPPSLICLFALAKSLSKTSTLPFSRDSSGILENPWRDSSGILLCFDWIIGHGYISASLGTNVINKQKVRHRASKCTSFMGMQSINLKLFLGCWSFVPHKTESDNKGKLISIIDKRVTVRQS